MSTRAILTPYAAEFPSTGYPQLQVIHTTVRRPVLAFDATSQETCYWTLIAPQGLTGTLTLVVTYCMASATTGGVSFDASVEAISDGDALDVDAAESVDAVNNADVATVPGTAGHIDQLSITLTNKDSVVAGDLLRIILQRAPSDAADTATGDCQVLNCELRDAA
jgi:hypothetical protein